MDDLTINTKQIRKKLVDFIREEVGKAGFNRVVVGLSGGVDSSLVTYLSCKALGRHNVLALIMPYKMKRPDSLEHANLVVKTLGIRSKTIDITPIVDVYFANFSKADKIRKGNMMARVRMAVLYDQSKGFRALVIGAGNRSEMLLGYCTIYGDTACALNPIGDLYKTQIYQLAKEVGVPETIIKKKPTAGLWPGQTDEGELGFSYEEVDRLLYFMVDKGYGVNRLLRLGFRRGFIEKVTQRIRNSRYKRRMSLIAEIS